MPVPVLGLVQVPVLGLVLGLGLAQVQVLAYRQWGQVPPQARAQHCRCRRRRTVGLRCP